MYKQVALCPDLRPLCSLQGRLAHCGCVKMWVHTEVGRYTYMNLCVQKDPSVLRAAGEGAGALPSVAARKLVEMPGPVFLF